MTKQPSEEASAGEQQKENKSLGTKLKDAQVQLLVAGLVVILAVVALVFAPSSSDGDGLFIANRYDFSQNADALSAEAAGFSYAYGTETNDDGSTLEDFTPATEEQIQEFIDTVASDEEQFDDDEDRAIFEFIEFDEWNDDGEIRAEVIEDFLGGEEN